MPTVVRHSKSPVSASRRNTAPKMVCTTSSVRFFPGISCKVNRPSRSPPVGSFVFHARERLSLSSTSRGGTFGFVTTRRAGCECKPVTTTPSNTTAPRNFFMTCLAKDKSAAPFYHADACIAGRHGVGKQEKWGLDTGQFVESFPVVPVFNRHGSWRVEKRHRLDRRVLCRLE